jgi:hypothetical protein
VLQSLPLEVPRTLIALRPPRPSSDFPGPSGLQPFKLPRGTRTCSARLLLSCTSTPPQRFAPTLTASLPVSPADPDPPSKSTSQKLATPQHLRTS